MNVLLYFIPIHYKKVFFLVYYFKKKDGESTFDIVTFKFPDNPSCHFRAATLRAAANRWPLIS